MDISGLLFLFPALISLMHLGLLAYWVVNTVRCKLKAHGINCNWQEIVRIGNTQKIITTHGINTAGVVIGVRKCLEPNELKKTCNPYCW